MVVKTLAKIVGAKAAGPAIKEGGGGGIEEVFITSNEDEGKQVSLTNATAAILYYESILQDSVRATITFTDTGGTVDDKRNRKNNNKIADILYMFFIVI